VFFQVGFEKYEKFFCVMTRNRTPKGREDFLKKENKRKLKKVRFLFEKIKIFPHY